MELEAEFLVPASNGYHYKHIFVELGENANRKDAGDRTPSISI